jgi:outer membrane protein assembly factor BamB
MTAWVAGVFSLLIGLAMFAGHLGAKAEDPLKSTQLTALTQKLRLSPADETLKRQIRELDLQLRQRYFRQLARTGSGAYLLLGGVAVFIFAFTQAGRHEQQPVLPEPKPDAAEAATRAAARARWFVAAGGEAIGALLFSLSLISTTALPERPADIEKLLEPAATPAAVVSIDAASPDEFKQNWPRFRGPEGGGVSPSTNAPVRWDEKTGAGILWKTATPAAGFNSPILWGDRVFFSGGDASKREVFCFDGKTGQLLWRREVASAPGASAQTPEIPDTTGYAASTMATDGRRVYVIFGNGDLAALDFDGKPVWSKSMGPLKNSYGHATSLATWRDRLILQLDQGESDDGKSKLYALDGRTGQIVWQKPRKAGGSWASPIVIEAAGKAQIVALAVPWTTAYAAADGAELWKVNCLGGEVTPSPVFAGGLVLVASPSEKLLAIRPDGQGDVTKSQVAWTAEDNVPDITSPVSNGELAFTLTSPGLLTCFDAKDGKKQWEHDFEMDCHASPALAGSRLYLFGQKGAAAVIEVGRQFKEIFRTQMADSFHASPAFIQDKMVLRGDTNVWCLGGVQ